MAKQSRVGLALPNTTVVLVVLWLCCFAAVTCGADRLPAASQKITLNKQSLQRLGQLGIDQTIFTTRLSYDDGHWYANIGYYCDDENKKAYSGNGKPDESMLYMLDVAEGIVRVLFDGKGGSVRDPQLHYDGKTVLFSYRRPDADYYNLYEMQIDGTGLRRITDVPYDDFEATYLPDDDIVFVSTRSKRWVGCWMTQVGTLFRCDRNGRDIRPLSVNLEHDNTPAVLPDGRILYTRWEYVDIHAAALKDTWWSS